MKNKYYVQPSIALSVLATEDVITASGENEWGFRFAQSGNGISNITPEHFEQTFDFEW